MPEIKHTPGPWRCEGPDDFHDFNILHNGDSLAVAAVVSNMRDLPQITANANLIAAAPEMLEALLDAKEWLSGWASAEPYLSEIEAVIAKATQ